MNLKNGKVFTSKFVRPGPSSYEKKNLPGRRLTKDEKLIAGENVSARRIVYDFLLLPYILCIFIRFWNKIFVYFDFFISYT